LATLFVFACVPGNEDGSGTSDGVTHIQYLTWGADPDELKIVRRCLEEFEKQHVHVKVQHITVPAGETYYAKLLTMIAGRTPPDVVYMQPPNFGEFAARGALREIDGFVKSDPDIHLEDFYEQILGAFTWQDTLYGLPVEAGTMVLYYNKALFDAKNIPYPDESWDHQHLLEVAKALTVRDKEGRIIQYGYMPFSWESTLWQFGGRILSDDGKRCLLNTPEAIEAFQYLVDLRYKHEVTPSHEVISSYAGPEGTGAEEFFKGGKLAMVEWGRWMMVHFNRQKDLDWDIAVLPKGKRQSASLLIGLGLCIPKYSKHPREAYELMKFLVSPQALKMSIEMFFPSRKSLAESPDFLSLDPDHNLGALVRTMPVGRLPPQTAQTYRILRIVWEQREYLYLRKKTAEEMCNDIVAEVSTLLR
jgi:multiple sugar transport system substrate-binding protein